MSKMLRFSSMEALQAATKARPKTAARALVGNPAPSSGLSSGTQTAKQRLQALGRKKPGELNKTEQRFVDEWIMPRVQTSDIVWWGFESVTLKLAPDCRLTVDFFVMRADGALQAYDVKGSLAIVSDDAAIKMRVAGDKFPWPFFYAVPKKKADGGDWLIKEVG